MPFINFNKININATSNIQRNINKEHSKKAEKEKEVKDIFADIKNDSIEISAGKTKHTKEPENKMIEQEIVNLLKKTKISIIKYFKDDGSVATTMALGEEGGGDLPTK